MTPKQRQQLNAMWRALGCNPESDECGYIEAVITLATLEEIRQGFENLKAEIERAQELTHRTRFDFGERTGFDVSGRSR